MSGLCPQSLAVATLSFVVNFLDLVSERRFPSDWRGRQSPPKCLREGKLWKILYTHPECYWGSGDRPAGFTANRRRRHRWTDRRNYRWHWCALRTGCSQYSGSGRCRGQFNLTHEYNQYTAGRRRGGRNCRHPRWPGHEAERLIHTEIHNEAGSAVGRLYSSIGSFSLLASTPRRKGIIENAVRMPANRNAAPGKCNGVPGSVK